MKKLLLALVLLLLLTPAYAITLEECCTQYPDKCVKTYNEETKSLQTQCKIPVETTLQSSQKLSDIWNDTLSLHASNEANWDRLYSKLLELNEFFKVKKDVTKLNAIKDALQAQIDKRQAIITFINAKLAE